MPKCMSCNKIIALDERAVHFPCPNCGAVTIWRCEKCRRFVRQYSCPKCGFTGP